jgi:predicted phosphodiesterase
MDKKQEIKKLLNEGKSYREIISEVWWSNSTILKIKKEMSNNIKYVFDTQDKQKLNLLKWMSLKDIKELINHSSLEQKKHINEIIWEAWHLLLWVISDTHYNNKLCAEQQIEDLYWEFADAGVDAIIHTGDITDWYNVYKWQIFELLNVSFDDQLKYVSEKYPKIEGKNTYLIQGNHDESWLQQAGIDFGKALEKLRPDIINLWFYYAKLGLNNINIWLQHWWWSTPYAVSYHIQKYMERIPKTSDLDAFVMWHYHRELFMMYRDMMAMLPWAFLKEWLLAKRFKMGNNLAGAILEIEKDENGKCKFNPSFIKYTY